MKIHFIISSLRGGGAERVLSLLAENLAKRTKYKISVITLIKGDEYSLNKSITGISLSHGKIKNQSIRIFVNLFKFYRKKENRPDIIISFMTLTNLLTIPIAKLFSIKIIAAEHNSYLRAMKGTFFSLFLSNFTKKRLYKRANLLTVLTSFDIDFYKKYGANVMVIPNPCTFQPIDIEKTPFNSREKVILAVGNLDIYVQKGFDNLIPLMAPILKSNIDWKLKIVGGGTGTGLSFLSEIVKKHELEHQIIFTGFNSNISELMKKSSIFILPSRFEGLPMVLLEAMSQGMACIAYDCKTGPSDIITNNVNGLLIEDQNMNAMREQLLKLMKNEELRISLSKNGINSLKRFDIESILNDYEHIFEKILTKK